MSATVMLIVCILICLLLASIGYFKVQKIGTYQSIWGFFLVYGAFLSVAGFLGLIVVKVLL